MGVYSLFLVINYWCPLFMEVTEGRRVNYSSVSIVNVHIYCVIMLFCTDKFVVFYCTITCKSSSPKTLLHSHVTSPLCLILNRGWDAVGLSTSKLRLPGVLLWQMDIKAYIAVFGWVCDHNQ